MSGKLVLVPTPLGNREDITLRALRVLSEADRIAAEDTRHTGRLLKHHGISTRMMSFHEHNEARQSLAIVELLKEGKLIALVSDAGMPGISDPGFRALRAAREAGLPVEVLPGPSAILPALLLSGLPCDRFSFEGFVPRKSGARLRLFESFATESRTTIFYESPHRIAKSVDALAELYPDREVAIVREISKIHEEVLRDSARALSGMLKERRLKGEIVLLLGPAT
ncbi:MAG: 16S rRNA (cytidine(1402)-2'-O)-methyltransferase [Candidatus Krumholzibacteria bacterium]|jgi:16S rRNA (cytidine1402-2'-O)-methyltransferase|nr:16S rRNA (cytidine(1402)-2'-O)-methyltransferase [Candidatus Krumholzibacteria bacterium]MDP6668754.1 16S rRNA (cytidine(1402)-2'-O)-methyltransferase [Candidatus Krumholzibacteria bacterium]MDP6797505.1 16S rRNA (cytidine(1402)-2'-O)-methyltransferase [Candidatus Krumholzibacteria bacterium]MDP7021500.1 16S rRNA (cytidine(1402)-2'-O)-methyltransferase [Candidatus Krumholzibacteria bacterium]